MEFFYQERTVGALDRSFEIGAHQSITVPLQPAGTQPPLFCLHNHAGHILEYRRLAQLLGSDQPVYGVRSININSHTNFRLENMAAQYVREIQKVQPGGPYKLCGNCFGGLVAFEVAQQLRCKGEQVAVLALIDTAYPADTITTLVRRLRIDRNWRELSRLPIRKRLSSLRRKLARFSQWISGRLEQRIKSGLVKRSQGSGARPPQESLRTVDYHKEVERRYRPRTYKGKMNLICLAVKDNQRDWIKFGGRDLTILQLSDQHSRLSNPHLVDEPYVNSLADELRKLLND
jgi:aspartate racemase